MLRPLVRLHRTALELEPRVPTPRGRRAARAWRSRGGTRPLAPGDVRTRKIPSSPHPRPLLTCAPRGPATVITLRATRNPVANSSDAAMFPSATGTCHLGQRSALRLTQRGAARSQRKAAIGSASRGERVSPSHWVVLLALHWLRRQNLFTPLAASANSTIFPIHWLLLVGVKVPLPLDPLRSFAMRQFLTTLEEKRDLEVGFPSNWL